METINEYLISVLVVSIVSGVILAISPDKPIKKQLRFAVSLCVTAVLLSPLLSLLGKTDGLAFHFDAERAAEEKSFDSSALLRETERQICKAISDLLLSKYKINRTDCEIFLSLDASDLNDVKITGVNVVLYGKISKYQGHEIEKYLADELASDVEVSCLER